jgi:hypothetical protein
MGTGQSMNKDNEMTYQTIELRLYKNHVEKQVKEWAIRDYSYPVPTLIAFENVSFNLRSGSRTKATGQPCKRKDIYSNG